MNLTDGLFEFIKKSPTSLHAAARIADELCAAGYEELRPDSRLEIGGKYFAVRGGAVVAFRMRSDFPSFAITASHSDSPALMLNHLPDVSGEYARLSVSRYGGAINYTWFDRPLAIAGRVMLSEDGAIRERLVSLGDRLVIPSVAPHLAREINNSFSPNLAVDLLPLYSTERVSVLDRLAEFLAVPASALLSHELYLYDPADPVRYGASGELILSPRIDDLASVYTALRAFVEASDTDSLPILAVFDHEEVGSGTKEGAGSGLLSEVLSRICPDKARLQGILSSSLMLSVDGAHALHPNHPELSDPINRPVLGGGVAVKYSPSRSYATDAEADALLRTVASRAGITLQSYANRADLRGGSTLGSIAAAPIGIPTVDIGIPQLAMHSIEETCAVSDVEAMADLLLAFYSSSFRREGGALYVTCASK